MALQQVACWTFWPTFVLCNCTDPTQTQPKPNPNPNRNPTPNPHPHPEFFGRPVGVKAPPAVPPRVQQHALCEKKTRANAGRNRPIRDASCKLFVAGLLSCKQGLPAITYEYPPPSGVHRSQGSTSTRSSASASRSRDSVRGKRSTCPSFSSWTPRCSMTPPWTASTT